MKIYFLKTAGNVDLISNRKGIFLFLYKLLLSNLTFGCEFYDISDLIIKHPSTSYQAQAKSHQAPWKV